jgi:hypothetical protein
MTAYYEEEPQDEHTETLAEALGLGDSESKLQIEGGPYRKNRLLEALENTSSHSS